MNEPLHQNEKIELITDKMYYGFPVVLIGYQDGKFTNNFTTTSSSYTLGDMLVLGVWKHGNALKEIRKIGCFTINVPSEELMKEIEIGGSNSGEDKFTLAPNLSFTKSEKVDAPIINECMINIECEVIDIIELDEFSHYCNVISKVKGRLVDHSLQENGVLKRDKINPVFYLGDDEKRSYRYLNYEIDDFGDFS